VGVTFLSGVTYYHDLEVTVDGVWIVFIDTTREYK
jgi:hypothetical protein